MFHILYITMRFFLQDIETTVFISSSHPYRLCDLSPALHHGVRAKRESERERARGERERERGEIEREERERELFYSLITFYLPR